MVSVAGSTSGIESTGKRCNAAAGAAGYSGSFPPSGDSGLKAVLHAAPPGLAVKFNISRALPAELRNVRGISNSSARVRVET